MHTYNLHERIAFNDWLINYVSARLDPDSFANRVERFYADLEASSRPAINWRIGRSKQTRRERKKARRKASK